MLLNLVGAGSLPVFVHPHKLTSSRALKAFQFSLFQLCSPLTGELEASSGQHGLDKKRGLGWPDSELARRC